MIPAEPLLSEVQQPTGSGAVDAASQPKPRRRLLRAARRPSSAADKPRPEEKSALLAWAYVEYQRLRQQGQPPDIHQWCALFPSCRSALRQVLEVEAFAASFLDRRCPSSGDEAIDWPVEGEQRADFTFLRELARGAFARVYLATEGSTGDRLVVLKCSLHGDAEARTLGRLAHPHIVPVLSARTDEQSGLTLVCMPYLGSATFEDVLDHLAAAAASKPREASFLLEVIRFRAQPEDPPLPSVDPRLRHGGYADTILHLAAKLAETLAFLHQNGVCHRDLKPSNVLLDPSGKPLLLDFNLSESERETAVPVGGTLRYMAPEQIRAFRDQRKDGMDERTDIYALGVMVYELLGGVHPCASLLAEPFRPAVVPSMLAELNGGFRPFREICPELEHPVAAALDRCVAFDVSDRPGNAAELAAAIQLQFTPARRLRRRLTAHRRWLLGMLGLLLLAVAVFAYVWAITPPYSQREYERGRIAYRAGDFARAETHFDQALRAEPNNEGFRYARGCARLQRSKNLPPEQVPFDQIWDDLVRMDRGAADAQTLAVKAYIQVRKQHYEEAIAVYGNPVLSGYRPVMMLNNRAYSYFSRGQLREAQDDLDKAVEIDPRCQAARYNRALIAMRRRLQGKTQAIPPQALEDIEQAIQLGPKCSALYRDAAILYAQAARGDPHHSHFECASSYLRRAIAAGEPLVKFRSVPLLREALKRPEFSDLLVSLPSPASPPQELRIIAPVDLAD